MAETLPNEDPGGEDDIESGATSNENQNVLYVRLPEGHPIITGASDQAASTNPVKSDSNSELKMSSMEDDLESASVELLEGKSAPVQPSLSFEEAVEQAELIFDDGDNMEDIAQMSVEEMNPVSASSVSLPSETQPLVSDTKTMTPDLKLEPVLSVADAPTSISSLFDTNTDLPTAKPADNAASDNLVIEKVSLETTTTTDSGNNLQATANVKIEKEGENKQALTIIKVQKECNISNEKGNQDVRTALKKQVSNHESAPKTRNRKIESYQTIISNSKPMSSSNVVIKREFSPLNSAKATKENSVTEVINSKEKLASPVNKNQKIILQVGKRNQELKLVSNSSPMVMTNVEDEINADGVTNHQLSTIANQQNLSVDVTDSRGTDAKIKEEIPKSTQIVSTSETSPHHNLRPKRSLRHVHALKQQAKRRKRNTSIAAAAASSGATSSTNISNSPDPSTITIQRTMSRKTSIGKDNGGKF